MSDCLELFNNIIEITEKINSKFILNLSNNTYEQVCTFDGTTFDSYFKDIKSEWENMFNKFINESKKINKCNRMDPTNNVLEFAKKTVFSVNSTTISPDFKDTLIEIAKVFGAYCSCDGKKLFEGYLDKYRGKIFKYLQGIPKEQLRAKIEDLYNNFKMFVDKMQNLDKNNMDVTSYDRDIIENITNKLTNLYSFSLEGELNKLIPDKLGSMKQFFITVISTYYRNLHPIIWCQIIVSILKNWFIELPFTPEETFAFLSKSILLNSGPFILKILQTIRPVLSDELKKKYKLERLVYPVLTPDQSTMLLDKIMINKNYKIIRHISASVGHVCVVEQNGIKYVVKFIKPLSIIQSCWEYKVLINAFSESDLQNECNRRFVKNMLESNGKEMNVGGEIQNLIDGNQYYSCNYSDILGKQINMKLTTITNVDNIIVRNWYSLVMSLAPGVPVSSFLEPDNILQKDTVFRAMLHRGLDLVVFKFFYTIMAHGFYHGDLHAGNIFFSYKDSQVTLIDFGAVGKIDLFNDSYVEDILNVVFMLVFGDYDGILDKIAQIANKNCPQVDRIDMNTDKYRNFKQLLINHKINKIRNAKMDSKKDKQYKEYMFGDGRINEEYEEDMKNHVDEIEESIYSIYNKKNDTVYNQDKYALSTGSIIEKQSESKSLSTSGALLLIVEFYADLGVNLPSKLSELFEFQKAYSLLLGVLAQTNYDQSRVPIIFSHIMEHKSGIVWANKWKIATNVQKIKDIFAMYKSIKSRNDEFIKNNV